VLDERVGRHVEREDALDARDGGWIVHGQSLRRRAQREIHVLQRARVEEVEPEAVGVRDARPRLKRRRR
jgi:hypothetical protein